MVVCQRVFALLVNGGHSLDEHLRQVIQDTRQLHVDQRNRQGQPLTGFYLQHPSGVQSPGLRREMPDLHIGNAAQRLRPDPVLCQPGPPVQPDFEMRQGRASRLLLEHIPGRETGLRIRDKEGFDAGLLLGAKRGVHLLVEPAIEDAADMARCAGQGVESGKLILFPHQFLNGDVDEVGQLLLRLGRLAHGRRHGMARFLAVTLDMERLADDLQMPPARPGEVVTRQAGKAGLGLGGHGDVFHDAGWNLADRHKISQALKGLQQNQKAQAGFFPASRLPGQG